MTGSSPDDEGARQLLARSAAGRPEEKGAQLILTRLVRAHGGRPVWAPVDLQLAPGTLTLVTGPNGAGKTTLLRVAAGLLRPTAGSRWCAGPALYVRGGGGLRSAQTVSEAVTVTARLAGRPEAAADALHRMDLDRFATRRVGTLSAGERVRVALAAACSAGPALLCLDEPTAALDARGLSDLASVLDDLRSTGCSLLVATHQPETLLTLADAHLRVVDGRVVAA